MNTTSHVTTESTSISFSSRGLEAIDEDNNGCDEFESFSDSDNDVLSNQSFDSLVAQYGDDSGASDHSLICCIDEYAGENQENVDWFINGSVNYFSSDINRSPK